MKNEDHGQLKLTKLSRVLGAVPDNLGLTQLIALLTIAAEPGLSVNELAERLDSPQQTASRHVAALLGRYDTGDGDEGRKELDPLITQEISQSDPRRRALFLSPQGRALLRKMVAHLE